MKVPRVGSVASYRKHIVSVVPAQPLYHCAHPFHAVTRSDLTELFAVVQLGDVSGVGELRVVRRRAEVEFPSRLGERVETAGSRRRCRRGRGRAGRSGCRRRGRLRRR